MAVSAARFMFNAAPAFAITSAWVIAIIIDKLNLGRYISDIKRASKPTMTPNLKIGLVVSVAAMFVLFLVLTSISTMAFPVFVVGIVAICGIYMLNLIAETNPNRMYNLLTILVPISAAIFYILSEFYWSFEFTDATHLFILALLLFAYGVLFIQVRRISFFFTMGVVFLAFCVVVPNVWAGIDAGIPYETKADLDKQIYNAMPSFLQPSDYDVQNGTNWYLGGFGYSLPLNSRYWPAAYDWLATQDKDIYPVTQRPAFLSWWDYGFEVVNEGQHPTVADNFLGGHQLAGNFIMAQSEKDAIALLCVRLLEGNWYNHWEGIPNSFDAEILDIMDLHGIDSSKMIDMFENPSKYVDIILKNPDIYGPRDEIIQDVNANYIAARVLITQNLNDEQVVNLYRDISRITGTSIRYFGIDSRLFPFSAQNTGIFYAPAKLSDHRISDIANQPYDFWEIKAIGEFGGEYDLDAIPSDVRLNPETPYKIVYKEMFYNSMLYKAFIGYSGYDIGQGEAGIPALSGDLASSPIMPGWNMSHFKLVHRTSYWNPYSANEIQNHTDAWRAMNYWDAYEKQQAGEGISALSDRSSLYQGTMMLKYYHGAVISGKVTLKDGTPLGGVSVTVMDDFGIPHQRVVTDSTGYYSLIAPPGDITLIASTGSIDPMYLIGNSINQTAMFIYDYQAMRLDEDRNSDGKPDWQIEQNMIVEGSSMSGLVFWDVDSDGTISDADYKIDNTEVSIINSDMAFNAQTLTDESGEYNFTSIPPGTYDIKVTYANRNIGTLQVTISSNEDMYQDLAISTTTLTGIVSYNDGSIARGVKVRLWNTEENIEFTRYTDQNGTYHFESLLHGRFLIQAESDAFASIPQILDIVQFEYNIQNVTMYSSFLWSGTVTLNDNPVPYCTIKFAGASDSVIVADSSGRFKARLLDGNYFYYVSHTLNNNIYSAIGRLYATEDQIKNIVLGAGSLVIGHATDENGVRVANTQIVFNNVNSGTYISANTDSSGDYSIIIPHGAYRIQISSDSYGSYYAVHEFNSRTNVLNLKTRPAEPVYGSVFWDVDSNGVMGEDEYIGDARVTFKEPTGAYAQAITDENGLFLIYLPSSVSYDVVVSRDGFHPVNLGVQTHSSLSQGIHQFLEPIYIPVSGGIYLDDELLQDQNIILHFDSQIDMLPSKEIQVARDGTYSGQLIPGYYAVAFTHNVSIGNDSEVYQIDEKFIIDTSFYDGEPLQLDITAVQRTKISVTIANPEITGANITFKQGPESRNFNMNSNYEEFYLKPGNYVMSAVHPLNDSIMVDMKDVSVDDVPNNYTVSLKRGVSYSGTLKYGPNAIPYQKITFQDMNSNGTITVFSSESGTYEIILVPNLKYQIIVDFVDYETEPYLKAYRYYTLDHTIDAFTSMSNQIILLEREDFSSVLIGRVTYNGILAPGTELIFTSEFATHRVVTDEFGEYSLDIIPAEYTVYAHHPSHYVSLFKIQIEIDQDILDIDLVPGVRVYGTAYYDMNKIAMTSIEFTSNSVTRSISTDSTGYYEIWLPAASYSLKSEMKSMKYGIEVTYSAAINFELKSDKQMNIPLSMIEERVVFVSFDLTQLKVIDSNSSVRYTFDVENMGNIRDTYTLAATGGTLDWIIDFSVSEVTVDPGAENKVRLSMNVFIPASTKTTQNTITVTAISQKDSTVRHSNVMNVPIRQKHGFVIQPSATSPQLDAGDIKSEFSILNKGNGVDSLTVYIANNEDLLRNGWSVELGSLGGSESMNDGKRLVNVSVNSGSTINIPIYLTPSNENPSRQANVLVIAYSQIDNAFITSNNIILQYPILQMSSDNLTAAGLGVSEAQSGDQLVNVGVMVASVSAALLIFYFARKKRWIR
jgi:dolichyl-diphosphooligosaccharide--protein glycosyltransferase